MTGAAGLERNLGTTRFVPFLKWAGGKRWLVSSYADLLPQSFNTYIEPFLGAGSVFFHMRPERALLGDANPDLVATYEVIKNDWQALRECQDFCV
jgi:DNA adenine methylase